MNIFQRKLTPLKYQEVIRGLTALGFTMKPKTATAHEQWIKYGENTKWLVTVDKHIAPFARDLIKLMARQAGVDPKRFHALCKGDASLKQMSGAESP